MFLTPLSSYLVSRFTSHKFLGTFCSSLDYSLHSSFVSPLPRCWVLFPTTFLPFLLGLFRGLRLYIPIQVYPLPRSPFFPFTSLFSFPSYPSAFSSRVFNPAHFPSLTSFFFLISTLFSCLSEIIVQKQPSQPFSSFSCPLYNNSNALTIPFLSL